MSYYINHSYGASIVWYINQQKPIIESSTLMVNPVVTYFQASGEELEHILSKFKNIPIGRRDIAVWRGWMAQFIYDNL